MFITYHYEFSNIFDFDKITYKVAIPIIKNAKWINNVEYYLFEDTIIQIFIDNHLLDRTEYDPLIRLMYDQLNNKTSKTIFKLFPGDILLKYNYLLRDNVPPYKVICDIKININPKLENICIANNGIQPEIKGNFIVEEIIE